MGDGFRVMFCGMQMFAGGRLVDIHIKPDITLRYGFLVLLILFAGRSTFGQSIRVDPDGEFSAQTLSLP